MVDAATRHQGEDTQARAHLEGHRWRRKQQLESDDDYCQRQPAELESAVGGTKELKAVA